ncbi:MAG TPA: hypothetical protein VF281_04865 [Candidatus Saccharimonadales bacterium]
MPIAELMFIIAVVLLAIIVVLLTRLLRKPMGPRNVEFLLNTNVEEVLERVGKGVKHHADVSAVLALMDQIEEHPDAIKRLQEYPEMVRAAAWLHYINCLGADLQSAQNRLSAAHRATTDHHFTETYKQNAITTAQKHVNDVRAKLDAAIAASGQKVGPRAI